LYTKIFAVDFKHSSSVLNIFSKNVRQT